MEFNTSVLPHPNQIFYGIINSNSKKANVLLHINLSPYTNYLDFYSFVYPLITYGFVYNQETGDVLDISESINLSIYVEIGSPLKVPIYGSPKTYLSILYNKSSIINYSIPWSFDQEEFLCLTYSQIGAEFPVKAPQLITTIPNDQLAAFFNHVQTVVGPNVSIEYLKNPKCKKYLKNFILLLNERLLYLQEYFKFYLQLKQQLSMVFLVKNVNQGVVITPKELYHYFVTESVHLANPTLCSTKEIWNNPPLIISRSLEQFPDERGIMKSILYFSFIDFRKENVLTLDQVNNLFTLQNAFSEKGKFFAAIAHHFGITDRSYLISDLSNQYNYVLTLDFSLRLLILHEKIKNQKSLILTGEIVKDMFFEQLKSISQELIPPVPLMTFMRGGNKIHPFYTSSNERYKILYQLFKNNTDWYESFVSNFTSHWLENNLFEKILSNIADLIICGKESHSILETIKSSMINYIYPTISNIVKILSNFYSITSFIEIDKMVNGSAEIDASELELYKSKKLLIKEMIESSKQQYFSEIQIDRRLEPVTLKPPKVTKQSLIPLCDHFDIQFSYFFININIINPILNLPNKEKAIKKLFKAIKDPSSGISEGNIEKLKKYFIKMTIDILLNQIDEVIKNYTEVDEGKLPLGWSAVILKDLIIENWAIIKDKLIIDECRRGLYAESEITVIDKWLENTQASIINSCLTNNNFSPVIQSIVESFRRENKFEIPNIPLGVADENVLLGSSYSPEEFNRFYHLQLCAQFFSYNKHKFESSIDWGSFLNNLTITFINGKVAEGQLKTYGGKFPCVQPVGTSNDQDSTLNSTAFSEPEFIKELKDLVKIQKISKLKIDLDKSMNDGSIHISSKNKIIRSTNKSQFSYIDENERHREEPFISILLIYKKYNSSNSNDNINNNNSNNNNSENDNENKLNDNEETNLIFST
ncbi:hypothetical protein DICPUDRAFT_76823 [Dictyostelium purpureum]|uniref:Uncharacterized protein n=1 Tax=Dictyostelium purpureum TaxID=5786 RepID=F0ZER3_DICPU|nr:uncharacterized protein DICPUDRAFT_76823 [Dictyostelium purpureum]EGC37584.1 hypothetical protein DICPUDRAFT_76823 [Dictyostelium purpureum]|eukprot:XP_003285910.1 hypothetical protein DICPUDRAFT_76823 [Dictyostelium purpureum]